ncbi:hypothetical protein ACFPRL_16865 [Pseudoclavibacter helvolus]
MSPALTCQETISASVSPSPTSGSSKFSVLIGVLASICAGLVQYSSERSTASRMRSASGR